ncbi:hypothetical protein [Enterococcus sp. JM9B]|uniref:hypothetical protein n=1 Tax=Enterococcus sp. JM9B TaxID=1857216 RepID=UPI001374B29E|nr:hypothetical protein [Enterococcus sp. JM9B]KAF1302811.1 hypothetical protein BAU16_05960 [Enterococcus sp. JM9B]
MKSRLKYFPQIFDFIYEIVLLNSCFLVSNVIFFQIFFVIDLKFEFLPIYFLTSLTFYPSLSALLKVTKTKNTSTIVRVFCKEFKNSIKKNWQQFTGLNFLMFILIGNLYLLTTDTFFSATLSTANLLFAFLLLLFLVTILEESGTASGNNLLKKGLFLFLKKGVKNLLFLTLAAGVLVLGFKISFFSMLFIFGLIIKMWDYIFIGRETSSFGISN